MAQASFEAGNFRPRVIRSAVAPHWLGTVTEYYRILFLIVSYLLLPARMVERSATGCTESVIDAAEIWTVSKVIWLSIQLINDPQIAIDYLLRCEGDKFHNLDRAQFLEIVH